MIPKLFSSQLRINMVSGAAANMVSFLVLALTYPIYLRFLGYETYGLWLTLGTVLAFAQLGELGICSAMVKIVAEEEGKGNRRGVEQHVLMSSLTLGCTGSLMLAAILLFRNEIIGLLKLGPEAADRAKWLLPLVGLLSVYTLIVQALNAALSGLGRMDLSNYIRIGGRILGLVVSVLFLAAGLGLEGLLIGSFVSDLIMQAASVYFMRRIASIRILRRDNLSGASLKKLLGFGSGVLAGNVVAMLIDPFNKVMLTRFAGLESVPLYDIAFRGSRQIRALIETSLRALMPEISRIHADPSEEARKRIARLNRRAGRITLAAGSAFYLPLFLFAPFILHLWLGVNYKPELPLPFRIILAGTFISLLSVPAYYLLLGVGRVFATFQARLMIAACNVILVTLWVLQTHRLTVVTISACLFVGWTVSTVFLLWKARKFLFAARTTLS